MNRFTLVEHRTTGIPSSQTIAIKTLYAPGIRGTVQSPVRAEYNSGDGMCAIVSFPSMRKIDDSETMR